MSSEPSNSRPLLELDLSSSNSSPSHSWSSASGTGVIPIFLDPSLAMSSSRETLPAYNPDFSLTPLQSTASVGTFGQPLNQCSQRPRDLNLQVVSARINAWRNTDAASRFASQSFNVPTLPSLPFPPDFNSMVDFGPSSSTSSTPTTASSPLTNGEKENSFHSEAESVFTLSAYLASASIYGDVEDDNVTLIAEGCTPNTGSTPLVVHSHLHQDDTASALCDMFPQNHSLCDHPTSLAPLSAGHSTLGQVAIQHSSSLAVAVHIHQAAEFNAECRTPISLKRKKSELDVPLSPTSTFILSPSTSMSSQYRRTQAASNLSTSDIHTPPRHQATHCRAASAPLSPISFPEHDAHGIDDKSMDTRALSSTPPLAPSPNKRRFRSVSNSHVPAIAAPSMRPSSCSDLLAASTYCDLSLNVRPKMMQEETGRHSTSGACASLSTAPAWIKSTTIELWIDQEGFRSIQPKFDLVEYWRGTGLSPRGHALDVAEFAMKKRQTWHFHHAILDSPPVLRRLTVNGDMNDYISRQAALTLKYNGVYAVESTEDRGKLAWKFEYLVEDRRVPETGKIINGEKRFTPLSFVCNPELLTSEYGKKVKLLHFVRKSVTPKLQSFKLSPLREIAANRLPIAVATMEKPAGDWDQGDSSKRSKDTLSITSSPYQNVHQTTKPRVRSWSKSPISLGLTSGETAPSRSRPHTVDPEVMAQEDRCHSEPPSSDSPYPGAAPLAHTALPSPGQRIVSPTLLQTWFPPHVPRLHDFSESTGHPLPPPSCARLTTSPRPSEQRGDEKTIGNPRWFPDNTDTLHQ